MKNLIFHDKETWFATIWQALSDYRENCIPEGDEMYDEQWDDICTAMSWIAEEVGVDESAGL